MAFTVQVLHFKSPDPKVTAQWYVDNLGATITRERQILGGTTGYQLDLHGVPLLVTSLVGGSQKLEQFYGLEHIGLFTGDLDGFLEQFKAGGGRVLEEGLLTGAGQKCCFIEGPEGFRIELTATTP